MRHPATLGKRPDDGAVDVDGVAIGAGVPVVMDTGAPQDRAAKRCEKERIA
jgi:hypothetical protein